MKNIRIIAATICLTLVMAGCSEEFLELSPQQSVADTEALVAYGDFESSITAVYNGIGNASYYGRYFMLVPDVMSDDVKQHPSANRAATYAEYVATRDDGIANGLWTEAYQNINNLNTILATDIEVTPALQAGYNHIKGEAMALRGLIHFDLVRMFGQHYTFTSDASHLGVPIVTVSDPFAEPTRSTVKQVYDQAISDMTTGLSMMQNNPRSGSTSTLSRTAVEALLARVYLYKDDLPNAITAATNVINSQKYSLVPNAEYASAWSSDFSDESIFEIHYTSNDNNGSDALGRMYILEGYGDYLPSNDLVSLIPMDDARRVWFKEDTGLSGDYAPFRLDKYPNVAGFDNTKVIRLSEMYLIRAEARARQMDNTAQDDINMIRQRAQPSAPAVTATGTALLDEALLERRKELAFEGQRLWDLMRYKKNVVSTECTSSVCTVNYPSERVIMPIPLTELDANPNMVPNPGF